MSVGGKRMKVTLDHRRAQLRRRPWPAGERGENATTIGWLRTIRVCVSDDHHPVLAL